MERATWHFFLSVAWMAVLLGAPPPAEAQTPTPAMDLPFDAADSTTGWLSDRNNLNTLSLDTQIKVDAVASLKSVGTAPERFYKLLNRRINISNYKYLTFWYYIDRPDLLATTGDRGQVEITSASTFDTKEWNWPVPSLHLQRGWNYIVLSLPGAERDPFMALEPARVNFFRIYHRPTASITTRIDRIVFTNRPPRSFAFAEYLEQKRLSRSTATVELEDDVFKFIDRTAPGSTQRAEFCRRLRIDLTHREINGVTLVSMGVTQAAVNNFLREQVFLKEFLCGERVAARTEVLTHLQQRAAFEIAVTGEIATLFDMTFETAAETKEHSLNADFYRILHTCGSEASEVDRFIKTGALPPTVFQGLNILVQNCFGTPQQIAAQMAGSAPQIADRGATYRQCMSMFESQSSECTNAFNDPNEDFIGRVKSIPGISDQEAQEEIDYMRTVIAFIHDMPLDEARRLSGATHAGGTFANNPQIENLHELYDISKAEYERAKRIEGYLPLPRVQPIPPAPQGGQGVPIDDTNTRAETDSDRRRAQATGFLSWRLYEEQSETGSAMQKRMLSICQATNWTDDICDDNVVDSRNDTGPPPDKFPARCASMNVGGSDVWFDQQPRGGAFAGQINEGNRIDHCMCELFDRNYGQTLPGNIASLGSNCPSPEERIAQKCLENPYAFDPPVPFDPGSGGSARVRPECMHLMRPISMDREALGAKLCDKIMPNCIDSAVMNASTGSCTCPTVQPSGGFIHPSCTSLPNCLDGVVVTTALGCKCQPYDSGANACMAGGKDSYLTRNRLTDLKVREFPEMPAFSTINMLVPRTGRVSFVTPAIRRSELRDERQLQIRAVLPGGSYSPCTSGQIDCGEVKVYCSKGMLNASGVPVITRQNILVETIPLSGVSTNSPTTLNVNLDATERAACYSTSTSSRVFFEFEVYTAVGKPVAFYDILGEIGNIKPQCITTPRPNSPTPGPRPLNTWPTTWNLSDGSVLGTVFNGTGPMPTPAPPPPPPVLCVIDGIIRPCN